MKKILIIDDEPEVGEMLKTVLESHDYMVFTAVRALRGLEILQLESPDVIFLDIIMPDMDGLECLRGIKKIAPNVIVIMVSGLQDEEVAKQALRYGAYDYLGKPFDLTFIQDQLLPRIFSS